MKILSMLAGGLSGAVVLTLLHEATRRISDDAPRMDIMGMEALEKGLTALDAPVPERKQLFNLTMAGDLVGNALYYSLAGVGTPKASLATGAALGLAAGLGAVYLPKHIGLDPAPGSRTPQTKVMTTMLYLVGGLVAGAVAGIVEGKQTQR